MNKPAPTIVLAPSGVPLNLLSGLDREMGQIELIRFGTPLQDIARDHRLIHSLLAPIWRLQAENNADRLVCLVNETDTASQEAGQEIVGEIEKTGHHDIKCEVAKAVWADPNPSRRIAFCSSASAITDVVLRHQMNRRIGRVVSLPHFDLGPKGMHEGLAILTKELAEIPVGVSKVQFFLSYHEKGNRPKPSVFARRDECEQFAHLYAQTLGEILEGRTFEISVGYISLSKDMRVIATCFEPLKNYPDVPPHELEPVTDAEESLAIAQA